MQANDGAQRTPTRPAYYNRGGIECLDAIKAAVEPLNGFEGFCVGNAIKYLWRFPDKGKAQDLKKAQRYIGWLIEDSEEA